MSHSSQSPWQPGGKLAGPQASHEATSRVLAAFDARAELKRSEPLLAACLYVLAIQRGRAEADKTESAKLTHAATECVSAILTMHNRGQTSHWNDLLDIFYPR